MNSRRVVLISLIAVLVVAAAGMVTFRSQRTSATATCTPDIALVDVRATNSANCVAATLDQWTRRGVMAVGQQLDVQEESRMRAPLEALEPLEPAVVGFDFDEFLNAREFFAHDPLPYLADLAKSGTVLTATWHPANPVTGGGFDDRSWTDLGALLDPQSEASLVFWPEYDRLLDEALRLQDEGVAVVFKPLHEASGGWFWWGQPDPAVYKALFAELQKRAADRGVHNLLWAYAANPQRYDTDADPLLLVPDRIDLAGMDVYDAPDSESLTTVGYAALAERSPRMALTEVGPLNSTDGAWDPAVITETLRREGLYAAFALLWRDNPPPGNVYQISSLTGGPAWLATCPDGLCPMNPS